jgi:hypothetical protein
MQKQNKLILIMFVYVGLHLLSQLPFFSLVLTFWEIATISICLFCWLFNKQWMFSFALFFVGLALMASLLAQDQVAEKAGNVIYYLVAGGLLFQLWDYLITTFKRKA